MTASAAGFDLETLSTEEVKGLAFSWHCHTAMYKMPFDTMDSIARLIAREIDGTVYDQNNQSLHRKCVNTGVIKQLIIVKVKPSKFKGRRLNSPSGFL